MNPNPPENELNALSLLLFSVGGVCFGVDADQVSGISVYNGESDKDLFWFHEEMGFGGRPVEYVSPTIITIRDVVEPYRVIIDSMEEIAEFRLNEIGLLPRLLEPFTLRRGIWGVLPRKGSITLLMDFKLFLRGIRPDRIDSIAA